MLGPVALSTEPLTGGELSQWRYKGRRPATAIPRNGEWAASSVACRLEFKQEENTNMTETRQQLLGELDQAYREFRSLVEDLDEQQFERKWIDNRWGMREVAAHIAGWHGKLGAGLERMQRGERPVPEGENWEDVDGMNAIFAEHAKGKRRAEILAELDDAVRHFKDAAMRLSEDRLQEGKTGRRMVDLAGITHFREHSEMIRKWRGQMASSGRR